MPAADVHRRRKPAVCLTGLVSLALLAAGCGGGGSPGDHVAQLGAGPGAKGKYVASLAYSRCMRSHGVPNFPDPK